MKKVLTIAGSDCCGGVGIQADLRRFLRMGFEAVSQAKETVFANLTQ